MISLVPCALQVKVIATKAAQHFIGLSKGYNEAAWDSLHALQPSVEVLCDENEWQSYSRVKEDPVLHIEVSACACNCRRTILPHRTVCVLRAQPRQR